MCVGWTNLFTKKRYDENKIRFWEEKMEMGVRWNFEYLGIFLWNKRKLFCVLRKLENLRGAFKETLLNLHLCVSFAGRIKYKTKDERLQCVSKNELQI